LNCFCLSCLFVCILFVDLIALFVVSFTHHVNMMFLRYINQTPILQDYIGLHPRNSSASENEHQPSHFEEVLVRRPDNDETYAAAKYADIVAQRHDLHNPYLVETGRHNSEKSKYSEKVLSEVHRWHPERHSYAAFHEPINPYHAVIVERLAQRQRMTASYQPPSRATAVTADGGHYSSTGKHLADIKNYLAEYSRNNNNDDDGGNYSNGVTRRPGMTYYSHLRADIEKFSQPTL
jgi:hypothetical protein